MKKTSKGIAIILSFALVMTMCVVTKTESRAASKQIYAKKKSLTIKDGKTATVDIVVKTPNTYLNWNYDSNYISVTGPKHFNTVCKLKIKGKQAGKTTLVIKNNKNKSKIKIKIKIKGKKVNTKANLKKLKKLMKSGNKSYSEEYGYVYGMATYHGDDLLTLRYVVSDGSYIFTLDRTEDDGDSIEAELHCPANMKGNATFTLYRNESVYGTGKVPISRIRPGDRIGLTFDVYEGTSQETINLISEYINTHVHLLLTGMNVFLYPISGLFIEDIGFTNYKN